MGRRVQKIKLFKQLPLFWRFQLAVWSAFVLLTLPAKLEVSDGLLGAFGSYGLRDGFSFALTCLMRIIYNRIYRHRKELVWLAELENQESVSILLIYSALHR